MLKGKRMIGRESSRFKTIDETGAEWGISSYTVRTWLAQRKIGFVRFGRAIRIPEEEIERVISEGLVPALPERKRSR